MFSSRNDKDNDVDGDNNDDDGYSDRYCEENDIVYNCGKGLHLPRKYLTGKINRPGANFTDNWITCKLQVQTWLKLWLFSVE